MTVGHVGITTARSIGVINQPGEGRRRSSLIYWAGDRGWLECDPDREVAWPETLFDFTFGATWEGKRPSFVIAERGGVCLGVLSICKENQLLASRKRERAGWMTKADALRGGASCMVMKAIRVKQTWPPNSGAQCCAWLAPWIGKMNATFTPETQVLATLGPVWIRIQKCYRYY